MRNWLCAALAAAGVVAARGQDAGPPPLPAADPEIKRLIGEISAERIQRSVFVLSSFKTRHTLSDPDPSGDGIGAAAGWVRHQLEQAKAGSGGRLVVREEAFVQPPDVPRIPRPVRIANMVATLTGTNGGSARRIYVVSGHYDSRVTDPMDAQSPAPGADDDASGVAAVLELERVMSRYNFPATLIFMAVAGEEQNLNGSAHWAAEAARRGDRIEGMLNNDIIGNSRSEDGRFERDRVRLFAAGVPPGWRGTGPVGRLLGTGGENDLPARQLARAAVDCAAAYLPLLHVQLIYRADRYRRGGDQLSFLAQGYPAVRFTEPAEDYRREHQNVRVHDGVQFGDVVEAVDFAYTADVARLNAAVLASLARAPAPPANVRIDTAELANATTLRWNSGVDPAPAGYRIVWRDTTAPFWQHHRDVGAGQTQATLSVNKDDVVFGVEAFDAEGHVSYAVFPQPG